MKNAYDESGYLLIKGFLNDKEVQVLKDILADFHQSWQKANADFYAEQAVNSAYITNSVHLNNAQRQVLFDFIGSHKLMNLVEALIPHQPCFLNTQLFFDPVKKEQKNYWHRDPQYHLTLEEQESVLSKMDVIHCRLPFLDEPGIELIPGTHKRWDSTEELDVRLEQNGHKNHQAMSSGKTIPLGAGDLLIFSANMIHRGLYGMDRLAFDILFCQPDPSIIKFVSDDCLPNATALRHLDNPKAFNNTIKLKASFNKR
jgi:ectoine hydroxylase-related dioxygenase (phytanoyl-CoA dioxygenase family)